MREQIYLHNHSSNKLTDVSICEAESPTDHSSPDQHGINAEQSHWGKLERLLRRAAGGKGWPGTRGPRSSTTCYGAQAKATKHSLQPAWGLQTWGVKRGETAGTAERSADQCCSGVIPGQGRASEKEQTWRSLPHLPPTELTRQLPENNVETAPGSGSEDQVWVRSRSVVSNSLGPHAL